MANQDVLKLNRLMQLNLSTYSLHQQTFPRFRRIHEGQDIYLIASGKTASTFKPVPGAINIGVNRSFQINNYLIPMDYIFIQDYSGKTKEYIKDLNNYKPDTCIKFYGLTTEYNYSIERTIPEFEAINANALRYRTDWVQVEGFTCEFAYDISSQPLGCFGSITFPALQFALWTHPKRIFLVGCDCNLEGYAYAPNDTNYLIPHRIIDAYKKFKQFAGKYYPDVEIISIKPMGLKGIFKDI